MTRRPASAAQGRGYVALLRGINVGGKNLIKMADLRACFEALGCARVSTYIQSGNVLFQSGERGAAALTARIEGALSTRFAYRSRIVLVSRAQLERVVARAPTGFGRHPDRYRYDVLFLKAPMTPARALEDVSTKAGVDTAAPGPGVLYFSRLISKASRSHLSRIVKLPVYQSLTIRNWNTTTALLTLMVAA